MVFLAQFIMPSVQMTPQPSECYSLITLGQFFTILDGILQKRLAQQVDCCAGSNWIVTIAVFRTTYPCNDAVRLSRREAHAAMQGRLRGGGR